MRKRLIAFISCAVLLLCTAACGSGVAKWKPARASDEIAPYARRAIEIIDEYLDFEMSADEAEKELRELHVRMIPLNISEGDSGYNVADQKIDYYIDWLTMFSMSNHTDAELREYRDILAFQIGEKVSGKTYTALKSTPTGTENKLSQYIDLENTPFDVGTINQTADYCFVTLSFDTRNGVTAQDIQKSIESAFNSAGKEDSISFNITVYIYCYDQPAVCISVHSNDGSFMGAVRELGAADKENNSAILHEFDSIYGLSKAVAVVSSFVGIK